MRYRRICRRTAVTAMAAGVLLSSASAQEDFATWTDVQRILINTSATGANVPTTVTNIPILVRLHPGNFTGFARTLPLGADIRFAKANGTPLPYQIERWLDGTNNNDTAEIWVRLDTLHGNNSTQYFQMYFGKTGVATTGSGAAVFDSSSGYAGVWHLGETPDTAVAGLVNASKNAHHGRPRGTMNAASSVPGVAGRALAFNGFSDFVTFGDMDAIDGANRLTVSVWIKATQLRDWANIISKSESNANGWYIIQNGGGYNGSDDFLIAARNNGSGSSQDGATSTNIFPTGAWVQCVMVFDGTQANDSTRLRFYFNGAEQPLMYRASIPAVLPSTAAEVQIAKSYFENTYFYGMIDEASIIRNTRSAAWIKASYETQKPGANCLTFQSLRLPSILAQQPARDTVITQGVSLAFSVTVSSAIAVQYAWYKNGTTLAGRTAASFTLESMQASDSGTYHCRVTNADGSVQSVPVKVTVTAVPTPPVITVQPVDTTAVATTPAWLRLAATGATSYAWYRISGGNAVAVTGGTAARLTFASVRFADSGRYFCAVRNAAGTRLSDTVGLSVTSGVPVIAAAGQPKDTMVLEGAAWSMNVTATGEPTLLYRWYKNRVAPADTVPGQRTRTIS
ncbi:MAG: DUF2341 domain-containing protein, partial [Chitinispirillaceae bacterium]|nr:DUF2341 domain-containing protein [Chitinispirillaceae bacterium]